MCIRDSLYGAGVDPVRVRRQVGMVFQRPNPFPTMSIRENVLAGIKLNFGKLGRAEQDDLTERSLRSANLWEEVKNRLDLPGSGLSGGQQQRLCIARAIAMAPEAVSYTHLDVYKRQGCGCGAHQPAVATQRRNHCRV